MGESTRRRRSTSKLSFAVTLAILVLLTSQMSHFQTIVPDAHAQGSGATMSINNPNPSPPSGPHSIVDLAHTMTTFQIEVGLSDSPQINAFSVLIKYNIQVLHATGVDDSNGLLTIAAQNQGQALTRINDCADGVGRNHDQSLCRPDDGPGATSYAAVAPAYIPALSAGPLFTVTFNVISTTPAFSQIQLSKASVGNGTIAGADISVETINGYYVSQDCPLNSGVACLPPVPSFTVSKSPVKDGRTVFNGSASIPSQSGTITDYYWSWVPDGRTLGYVDTGSNSTAIVEFKISATYTVTLKITDSNGLSTSTARKVVVVDATIDVGISEIKIRPGNTKVLPGTLVSISAKVKNYGFTPQTVSLFIRVEGNVLNETNPASLAGQTELTLTAKWPTNSLPPKVYRIEAYAPPVTNSTTGKIIEEDIDNNLAFQWVQLILPSGLGFQLSLLPSFTLGLIAIGALGYGIARLRRRTIPIDTL